MHSLTGFAQKLIQWYLIHKRDLPWRGTRDPYRIWVSEIILQQTRVQQGLPYYERFIEAFPTVSDLAAAPQDDLLRLWQGLGYYSRARNMHQAAKYVHHELAASFPNSFEALLEMKGVGRYTAAAVASFAFNEKVPVVDGNVLRVLSRVFGIADDISSPKTQKKMEELASTLIPQSDPGTFNQAIMEFGAQHCVPVKPDCESCIFKQTCFAFQNKMVGQLPVKLKKTKVKDRYFHYIVFKKGEKLGLRQRSGKDIWEGLYEFYLMESAQFLDDKEIEKNLTELKVRDFSILRVSKDFVHILSHQRLHARFYLVSLTHSIELEGIQFYSAEELEKIGKPILVVRYLEQEKIL